MNADTSETIPDEFRASRDYDQYAEAGRGFLAMQAASNGQSPPEVNDDQAAEVGLFVNEAMSLAEAKSQRRTMGGPGISHDGDRDIWSTLGYPENENIDAHDLYQRYKRQDIARAIITEPVEATWREPPSITDTPETDDQTDFEKDIKTLLDGVHLQRDFFNYCEWADRLQRVGEYGLIFFGFDDGKRISQPVDAEEINGPEDLQYIEVFSQVDVTDWELAQPGSDSREPGLPKTYEIRFDQPEADADSSDYDERVVHHSRVLHLTEQPESSVLKHTPVLYPILNRLVDLDKVVGAAAEMYWGSADRKFFASAEGAGVDQSDVQRFDEQMYEMVNGMRTTAYGRNMDLEVIDGQAVDPSGIIDKIIEHIVSVVGIPKRILLGSERGDLASSQDTANWVAQVQERQTQFVTSVIIRRAIDLLEKYGVIAPPKKGEYSVDWPSLYQLDRQDKADLHQTEASAFKQAEDAVTLGAPTELVYKRLGFSQEEIESALGDETGSVPEERGEDATAVERTGGDVNDDIGVSSDVNRSDLVDYIQDEKPLHEPGDVVQVKGSGLGVVTATLTEEFAFPTPDGDKRKVTATTGTPAYVVALADGGSAAYRGAGLTESAYDPSPETDAMEYQITPRINETPDGDLPNGWDRETLLQWWSSIGGTWGSAVADLSDEHGEDQAERLASKMKDKVLATTRWRGEF